MREISPAKNLSADEYLAHHVPSQVRDLVGRIRAQKQADTRPRPSTRLVDRSTLLTPEQRRALVDRVAALVDENLTGRSDMCVQFAGLLQRGLVHLGLPARTVIGTARYFVAGREVHRWRHAWVRVGREVIDGNVDSLGENPMVPPTVDVAPYWGPIAETPPDRALREHHGEAPAPDEDVEGSWLPDLRAWIDAPPPG
jgi:hypothetical protein